MKWNNVQIAMYNAIASIILANLSQSKRKKTGKIFWWTLKLNYFDTKYKRQNIIKRQNIKV